MDRKQRWIAVEACWILSLVLLLGKEVNAEDSVSEDLAFLEWLGETTEVRDLGVDMDALIDSYRNQLIEGNDVNSGKESSQ